MSKRLDQSKLKSSIAQFVHSFTTQNGFPPTIREIAHFVNINSTSTIHRYLKLLEKEGQISIDFGKNRSIHLNGQTNISVKLLGKVQAGVPVSAIESFEGYVTVPSTLAKSGEIFALNVKGDSMIGAGILDGDVVIVAECKSVEDGEIAVAMIEEETTVKRWFKKSDGIHLVAENPSFKTIISKNAVLIGKVVALYREF